MLAFRGRHTFISAAYSRSCFLPSNSLLSYSQSRCRCCIRVVSKSLSGNLRITDIVLVAIPSRQSLDWLRPISSSSEAVWSYVTSNPVGCHRNVNDPSIIRSDY
ncbi:hypothetical protein KC320_g282 [Hortaea werneckii]|nr:hypothetical protein KC320_g282 [Hortaea werneckii]